MRKALHAFSANAIMEKKSPNFFGFKADTTGKPKDLTAISASVWYAKDSNNNSKSRSALNRHLTSSLHLPECTDRWIVPEKYVYEILHVALF